MTSSSREHTCPGGIFDCLTQGFAYATSDDGLRFDDTYLRPEHLETEYTVLVLDPSDATWAPSGLETASVLRLEDGTYRMYFTGHSALQEGSPYPVYDAIGMAESPDGITWTTHPGPVFEAENAWERICLDAECATVAGGVLEPSVLWNADAQRFEMWYAGWGLPADSFISYRIGRATSADGITWQRDPAPVLDVGPLGTWDEAWVSHVNVVKTGDRYHMFYHGSSLADLAVCDDVQCDGYTPGSIGYATSADGVAWERRDAPFVNRLDYAPHAFFVGGPAPVVRDDRVELYVFGNPDADTALVYNSTIARYSLDCAD